MAVALPQCSHITRKRGIYYFRKRLPQPHGEIALSLRTRHYREAEHLAWGLTQRWFGLAAEEIVDQEKLRTVLARELDRLLREGRERIIRTPYGEPAFVGNYEDRASERVYLKRLPLARLHDAICTVQWPELEGSVLFHG